jgi:hypothetical protein
MKRNALAAPFERAFQAQKSLEAQADGNGDLMAIHYRDEEAIYVQAAHDRVTVVFSTVFREETDRIFGKVFLQVRRASLGCARSSDADAFARNSLMPEGFRLSKMLHRSSIPVEILLSRFVT